jgi:hypothetical protein
MSTAALSVQRSPLRRNKCNAGPLMCQPVPHNLMLQKNSFWIHDSFVKKATLATRILCRKGHVCKNFNLKQNLFSRFFSIFLIMR